MRIARQALLLHFPFVGNVREVSQVRVEHDRTDHLYDVGCLCAGSVLRGSGASGLLGLLCSVSLGEQRYSDPEEAKHTGS